MDSTRAIIICLILAGAVLPVLGAVLAVLGARRTLAQHEADVVEAAALKKEWEAATQAIMDSKPADLGAASNRVNADFHARFEEHGLVVPSIATFDRNATGDLAVSRTLRLLAKGQWGNVALVVLGIAASTVADVWSLNLASA
ncbi:hypothetical protein [Agromyces ramosus]|uniref:Flp pilus-assembly TadE/G-like protein n=1 Tax=Agromyces ramosus TaxID=33879 RepID=A0ABU0RCI9_9MICO|nr:hypothetical protein [Agromyces ramosus]MDQ0895789.1 hypothetical protein [Agromyces ramosus]